MKAPLFPILDCDGIMKPAVLIQVEQALEAGIEEIGIIIQEHDEPDFHNLFYNRLPVSFLNTSHSLSNLFVVPPDSGSIVCGFSNFAHTLFIQC